MSTLIRVRDGVAHLSSGVSGVEDPSFLTAIVEGAGALLHWDATAGANWPDADIDDIAAASGWLADVYGPAVAAAASSESDAAVEIADADPGIVEAVLRLGHLAWARAWWPAGARIPALDPALLAAEIALTSHLVSHLLDDEDAVEHALRDAADAASRLAALPLALAPDGAAVSAELAELADDHGIALLPVTTAREEWALAAGGAGPASAGIELATGADAVRWADVPAQSVDAEGEARWWLRQHDGRMTLRVEVPAVDADVAATTLAARFGPSDSAVDLALERVGDRFSGETDVPASVAFLPAGERTLWVHDPVLAPSPGAPETAEARDTVIRFAADRLESPSTSLAERSAGASR
ncbi:MULTISPECIES: hypothetical protein [unclassified Microbacterium]|uniref:hypothetical protein n=1 Tax=unclassified Microbacterium TaxID=2609290 RepID=UPI000D507513|nr:hypothetical protein [Microbacterium sp. TPD7012]PVE94741.1 hypothetical protein DC434_12390 [Microbacterium sp. TPD7012]